MLSHLELFSHGALIPFNACRVEKNDTAADLRNANAICVIKVYIKSSSEEGGCNGKGEGTMT